MYIVRLVLVPSYLIFGDCLLYLTHLGSLHLKVVKIHAYLDFIFNVIYQMQYHYCEKCLSDSYVCERVLITISIHSRCVSIEMGLYANAWAPV